MRIALIGYGKMGHMIEAIALERSHQVVLKINIENIDDFNKENMVSVDVAIEFTTPHTAFENVKKCIDFGVPVISGSTGWNDRLLQVKEYCKQRNGTFLHASNFSIGVNIFFEINTALARLMKEQISYDVSLKEIHHTQKLDAPSGTAVTLAEHIIAQIKSKEKWVNTNTTVPEELSIISERVDPAPGTHHIKYSSKVDDIEIIHTAHSRKGFALGAVLAAEYILGKKGVFTMKDILNL
ncbi:MAG TPA: 4-hydroxy-tetrahydrodipicolinate reductase [Chitinophagaceae bacterium]|nr:4-hydroxy-tetrahydrodipicolinate reductase [Chitinophagaceae bacterium]